MECIPILVEKFIFFEWLDRMYDPTNNPRIILKVYSNKSSRVGYAFPYMPVVQRNFSKAHHKLT